MKGIINALIIDGIYILLAILLFGIIILINHIKSRHDKK